MSSPLLSDELIPHINRLLNWILSFERKKKTKGKTITLFDYILRASPTQYLELTSNLSSLKIKK